MYQQQLPPFSLCTWSMCWLSAHLYTQYYENQNEPGHGAEKGYFYVL